MHIEGKCMNCGATIKTEMVMPLRPRVDAPFAVDGIKYSLILISGPEVLMGGGDESRV